MAPYGDCHSSIVSISTCCFNNTNRIQLSCSSEVSLHDPVSSLYTGLPVLLSLLVTHTHLLRVLLSWSCTLSLLTTFYLQWNYMYMHMHVCVHGAHVVWSLTDMYEDAPFIINGY